MRVCVRVRVLACSCITAVCGHTPSGPTQAHSHPVFRQHSPQDYMEAEATLCIQLEGECAGGEW